MQASDAHASVATSCARGIPPCALCVYQLPRTFFGGVPFAGSPPVETTAINPPGKSLAILSWSHTWHASKSMHTCTHACMYVSTQARAQRQKQVLDPPKPGPGLKKQARGAPAQIPYIMGLRIDPRVIDRQKAAFLPRSRLGAVARASRGLVTEKSTGHQRNVCSTSVNNKPY